MHLFFYLIHNTFEAPIRLNPPLADELMHLFFYLIHNTFEAPIRFELMHKSFADFSLTTWVRRQNKKAKIKINLLDFTFAFSSGKRGSNPRHQPWQGRALPLSYSRKTFLPNFTKVKKLCYYRNKLKYYLEISKIS